MALFKIVSKNKKDLFQNIPSVQASGVNIYLEKYQIEDIRSILIDCIKRCSGSYVCSHCHMVESCKYKNLLDLFKDL